MNVAVGRASLGVTGVRTSGRKVNVVNHGFTGVCAQPMNRLMSRETLPRPMIVSHSPNLEISTGRTRDVTMHADAGILFGSSIFCVSCRQMKL